MCSHREGLDIYMYEYPNELARLQSKNEIEQEVAEELAYAFGWKIAAHVTVRELVYPTNFDSWDPLHLLELGTYLTGDADTVEATPEHLRYTWHKRMLSRMQMDHRLRDDVYELYGAEVHVKPRVYPGEWEIIVVARSLVSTLDNVDDSMKVLAPSSWSRIPPTHPLDEDAPPQQYPLH